MWIIIVTVGLFDVAFESMHSQVHFAQPDRLSNTLNPVKADIPLISILLVVVNKFSTLDKHTAGATGGIKNTSMKGLEDLDNEFNEGGRREELTPTLTFTHSEVTEKVLIDLSESIAFNIHRNLLHDTEEFEERVLFKAIVSLR